MNVLPIPVFKNSPSICIIIPRAETDPENIHSLSPFVVCGRIGRERKKIQKGCGKRGGSKGRENGKRTPMSFLPVPACSYYSSQYTLFLFSYSLELSFPFKFVEVLHHFIKDPLLVWLAA